jgi:hypothetical protein
MIDRRTLSTMLIASVATTLFGRSSKALAQPAVSARNVVLVHGAYADGSCWSDVIGRLQLTDEDDCGAEPADLTLRMMLRPRAESWPFRTDRRCS